MPRFKGAKKAGKKLYKRITLAKKVTKLTKQVRNIMPETKYIDGSAYGMIPSYSGNYISPLSTIAQADDDIGSRIGDKIRLKNVEFRMSLWAAPGAEPTQIRFIVFQMLRNPDQVLTNNQTIINLYLSSTHHGTSQFVRSFKDWDNMSCFRTLYDSSKVVTADEAANGGQLIWNPRIRIPEVGKNISYANNATGTVTKNEIFFCWISDTAGTASVDYQYRLKYIDP